MKAVQKGFTLIELMIVVAIIGILAAIALPAYQDYTIRSQVSEGPSLAEGIKTAVADYYATTGAWPVDALGVPPGSLGYTSLPMGTYITQIDVAAGGITVTYGNKAHTNIAGKTLSLTPIVSANGDMSWVCGLAAPAFADTAPTPATPGVTDVDAKYLPSSCKS
jgi:type IV pilus assembly protein PilA